MKKKRSPKSCYSRHAKKPHVYSPAYRKVLDACRRYGHKSPEAFEADAEFRKLWNLPPAAPFAMGDFNEA